MAAVQRHKRGKMPSIYSREHILCVLLLLPYVTTLAIQQTYSDPLTRSFNHFAVDSRTGHVYIGAVNKIYQLTPDLELEQSVVTGPDSKSRDNVNKVLLIDYKANRLITCGSAQGFCSERNLNNISQVREVQEKVVSNEEASTVAFIAEGPLKKQVMYVGATYTSNPDDNVLPAVISRSLERSLFSTEQRGTNIFINSLSRDQYIVNYVYGFSSEGFSYFLTTQLKEVGSDTYYSKLVRVCHDDENYYSYTEIPITCKGGATDYNLAQAAFVGRVSPMLAKSLRLNAQEDVLFAAFSPSENKNTTIPSGTSALCIYSLKDIRHKFTQNIQYCFSGHGSRGLNFISPSSACAPTNFKVDDDFCGMDVNTPLGGEDAVEAVPVTIFSDRITALVVPNRTYYTVVFAGTVQGHVKKILVDGTTASEYSDIVIDHGSMVKSLIFNSLQSYLYVMTERKVSIVQVQECSLYQSCTTCLEAKDPYCGWCPSENKCSTQSDCLDGIREPINWRQRISPYRNDTCAVITQVKPKQLQRTKSATLNVFINNLPAGDEKFYCVYKVLDRTITTLATRKSYGVDCDSPPVSSLPPIPSGHHRLKAKLYLRTAQETDLLSTNFIFFDCSSYTSCTECASSPYPCDWCIDNDRCTHDGAKYCHNDILVPSNTSKNENIGSCLSFHSKTDSNEILIHSSVTKAITVKAYVNETFVVQSRFLCEFIIEDQKFRVNAQLLADTIYCDRFEFTYTSPASHVTATFNILWAGGSKKLDNPDNIHIIIYRCDLTAEDCGTCLIMPEKYQCGWCHGNDKCDIQDKCGYPSVWFSQNRACPNPKIHSFIPQSGPWEGGTNITITGINLGRSISDIKEIIVADAQCVPIPELYIKSKQIVCRTEGPGDDNILRQGIVIVRVAEYAAASNIPYSFVNPEIHSIHPKYGPQSGGNLLQISGEHLNAGSDIKVYIDDLLCDIVETEAWVIVCKTRPSHIPKNCTVRVHFDNAVRILNNETFEYVEDPVILSVESWFWSSNKQPKGTPSGGTNIKVLGRNFHGIQFPYIRVYHNNRSFAAACHKVDTDTELRCKSPKVVTDVQLDPKRPLELEYGFDMADVQSVLKLSSKFGSYLLYPNPVYDKFEGIKILKSDYLILNGNNLDWACSPEEIIVRIGDKHCNVTSLSCYQLTCRPPLLSDLPTGVDAYDVVVKVGRKLRFEIGKISYAQNW